MRLAGGLLAALVALALLPAAASAHAMLERSSPERGAALARAPRQVSFTFSEPVEASFGAVRVFDAQGRRVDLGRVERPPSRPQEVAVGLRGGLDSGTYVATYRVISADGHPVSGGLTFTVGAAGGRPAEDVAQLLAGSRTGPVTETAAGLARGLTYLATALVLGGLAFLLVVWLPALRGLGRAGTGWLAASAAFAQSLGRTIALAAALGILAGVAGIALQGAVAAGTSAWAALDAGVLRDVLATRFGWVWALRIAAFAVLGALVAARSGAVVPALRAATVGAAGAALPTPPRRLVALGALPAAFLLLAPALAGHAAASSPSALLVPLDVVHVAATSLWLGGLAVLLAVVPAATRRLPTGERSALLAGVLVRFSPLALACVVALLLTGVGQALLHVDRWGALLDTGYGRAVLAKVLLLAALAALGAVNRQRVVPRLRALAAHGEATGAPGRLLRRTLRGEVALLAVVLGVTAALVSYAPPDVGDRGPVSTSARLGPLRLEATVDPARAGANTLHLYVLRAADGAPFRGTKELGVSAALPARGIGPLAAQPRPAGPGHFIVDGLPLAPRGEWELRVTDRVSDFDEYEARLRVPIR